MDFKFHLYQVSLFSKSAPGVVDIYSVALYERGSSRKPGDILFYIIEEYTVKESQMFSVLLAAQVI